MKKQSFIVLIMVFAILLVSASASWAVGHKSHRGHSPMEKVSSGPSLHCILKGHDLNNPCPHLLAKGDTKVEGSISSPCGGKTSNQNPFSYNSGSSSFFDLSNAPGYQAYNLNWVVPLYEAKFISMEPHPFDPPPKLS